MSFKNVTLKNNSKSLTKLPEVSIKKKDNIVRKSRQFDEEFRRNQILESANKEWGEKIQRSLKKNSSKNQLEEGYISAKASVQHDLEIYKTPSKFKLTRGIKDQSKMSEILKIKLAQTKQFAFKTPSRLQFQQKAPEVLREKSSRRKKSAIQLKTELKKTVVPYYSVSANKMLQAGYTTLEQDPKTERIKIRVNNQVEKWVNRKSIYYRIGEEQQILQRRQQIKDSQNFEREVQELKVNLNEEFLEHILKKNQAKFKSAKHKLQMKKQLITNYKMSILIFNKTFLANSLKTPQHKPSSMLCIPKQVINNLQEKLICSQGLLFLQIFGLKKKNYIPLLIDAQSHFRDFQSFNHFQGIQKFTKKEQLQKHLEKNQDRIDLIIFELQKKLDKIKETLTKDVQYVIKLNPRLSSINHKQLISKFIEKFQMFLGRTVRSILSYNLSVNLSTLEKYIEDFSKNEYSTFANLNHPKTQFYKQLHKINRPFITPFSLQRIQEGPTIATLKFRLKKQKKKTFRNIYKMILDSRKKIKNFDYVVGEFSNMKIRERLEVCSVFTIIEENLLHPIQHYIKKISSAENINGCTNGIAIGIHHLYAYDSFQGKMKELASKIEEEIVMKYLHYFSLFEFYYLQRPYCQEIIALFKKINGIKFIQDQVNHLKEDLKIIEHFPEIIIDRVVRIDVSELIITIKQTIKSNISKILKASQQVLRSLLTTGQLETIKAKKLNQLDPFTTIGEYIKFAKTLNQRTSDGSIHKVARNSLIIKENWDFLQSNNYVVRMKTMGLYLESGTWVQILYKSSFKNKEKLNVDYNVFLRGMQRKKDSLYEQYSSIIKELIEIIKVLEIVSWQKYFAMAQNISKTLKDLKRIAREIKEEEQLLKLEYYDETVQKKEFEEVFYREDFAFFFEEELYIQKFYKFWSYICKFKNVVVAHLEQPVFDADGENILLVIRQGQQLLYQLKLTTINKRLLGLMEKLHNQMQPYIKSMKMIKLLTHGSLTAKLETFEQIKKQIQVHKDQRFQEIMERKKKQIEQKRKKDKDDLKKEIFDDIPNQESNQPPIDLPPIDDLKKPGTGKKQEKNDENSELITLQKLVNIPSEEITISKLVKAPIPPLDYKPLYKIYISEQYRINILNDIRSISWWTKSVEIEIKQLKGCDGMQTHKLVCVNENFIEFMQKSKENLISYYQKGIKIVGEKQLESISQQYEQMIKKLNIFLQSLTSLKKAQIMLRKLYPWMQCIFPCLQPSCSTLTSLYRPKYDQFVIDYTKYTEYIKRMTFSEMFNEKLKIKFDDQVRIFQEMFVQIVHDSSFGLDALNRQIKILSQEKIFQALTEILYSSEIEINQQENSSAMHHAQFPIQTNLITQTFCPQYKRITYTVSSKKQKFYIELNKIFTISGQQIRFNQQKEQLFKVEINQKDGTEYICEFGLFVILKRVQKYLKEVVHKQAIQMIPICVQSHYSIRLLFNIFLSFQQCLFQSLLIGLYVSFYMDLSLVWENDYDITVLKDKIKEGIRSGFQAKEKENTLYVASIYNSLYYFIGLIDTIINRKNKQGEAGTAEGRQKRKYIFDFIPQLYLQGYLFASKKLNREWLLDLKKSKQDDFINETHNNPAFMHIFGEDLTYYYYSDLIQKIEMKQLEKKEYIRYDCLDKVLIHRVEDGRQKRPKVLNKKLLSKIILKCYGNQTNEYHYNFCPYSKIYQDEIEDSVNATFFLLEAQRQNRVLITDCHPNPILIGASFLYINIDFSEFKIEDRYGFNCILKNRMKMIAEKNQDCVLIVHEEGVLSFILENICEIMASEKNQVKPASYFYIFSTCIDAYEINSLSNREQILIYQQFKKFPRPVVSFDLNLPPGIFQNNYLIQHNVIYPYEVGIESLQLVNESLMRKPIFYKQKQLIQEAIAEFYREYDLDNFLIIENESPLVSAIAYQSFILLSRNDADEEKMIKVYMKEIAELLLNYKQSSGFVFNQSIKDKTKNATNISVYKIPIISMTIDELLGGYSFKETKKQKKTFKNISRTSMYSYSSFEGLMHLLLTKLKAQPQPKDKEISTYNEENDKFQKIFEAFRISDEHSGTQSLPTARWFILDLSVVNQTTKYLYKWLDTGLRTGKFVFFNNQNLYYEPYSCDTINKLIILCNKQLIGSPSKIPVPLMTLSSIYNPVFDFNFEIKQIIKILSNAEQGTPSTKILTKKFSKVIQMLGIEYFTPPVMKILFKMLRIMLNQVRKSRLANGLYFESEIPEHQKSQLFASSIDLRQRYKPNIKVLNQLIQIQKYLDHRRRQIHKYYASHESISKIYPVPLTEKKDKQNQRVLEMMSVSVSPPIKENIFHSVLLQCIFSAIVFQSINLQNGEDKKLNYDELSDKLVKLFEFTKEDRKKRRENRKAAQQDMGQEMGQEMDEDDDSDMILEFPVGMNLMNFGYDVASNDWVRWLDLRAPLYVQSCNNSEQVKALHPAQILRLNSICKLQSLKSYCSIVVPQEQETNKQNIFNSHELYWARYFIFYGITFGIKFKNREGHHFWKTRQELAKFEAPNSAWNDALLSQKVEISTSQIDRKHLITSNYSPRVPQVIHSAASKKKANSLVTRTPNAKIFVIQNRDQFEKHNAIISLANSNIMKIMNKWRKIQNIIFIELITESQKTPIVTQTILKAPYNLIPRTNFEYAEVLYQMMSISGTQIEKMYIEINLKKLFIYMKNFNSPKSYRLLRSFLANTKNKVDEEFMAKIYGYKVELPEINGQNYEAAYLKKPEFLKQMMKYDDNNGMGRPKRKKKNRDDAEIRHDDNEDKPFQYQQIWRHLPEIFKYIQSSYEYEFSNSEIERAVPRYLLKKPKKYKNLTKNVKPTYNQIVQIKQLLSTENEFNKNTYNSDSEEQGPQEENNQQSPEKDAKEEGVSPKKKKDENKENKKKKEHPEANENIQAHYPYVGLYEASENIILVVTERIFIPTDFIDPSPETKYFHSYLLGFFLYLQSKFYLLYIDKTPQASKIFTLRDKKPLKALKQIYESLSEPFITIQIVVYYTPTKTQIIQLQSSLDGKMRLKSDKPPPQPLSEKKQTKKEEKKKGNKNDQKEKPEPVIEKSEVAILRYIIVLNNKINIDRDIISQENIIHIQLKKRLQNLPTSHIKGERVKSLIFICKNKDYIYYNSSLLQSASFIHILDPRFAQIAQKSSKNTISKLEQILQKKEEQILQLLKKLLTESEKKYIEENFIGKMYINSLQKKKQEIKGITLQKLDDQNSKKQAFDNCLLQIDTMINQIEENTQILNQRLTQKEQCEINLSHILKKQELYKGEQQFKKQKQKLLSAFKPMQIEKQLSLSTYIEDYSFNLSFLYRFNVLADSSYCHDNISEILNGHDYEINGNYPIYEEQKRNFIKLLNSGRIGIILENENYTPNWEQVQGYLMLLKKFSYFGPGISQFLEHDFNYEKESAITLKSMLSQQKQLINQFSNTPAQRKFHIYLTYLGSHFYIKNYLQTNKSALQKKITTFSEEIKTLQSKINSDSVILNRLQQNRGFLQKKYEKVCSEVSSCMKNQIDFESICEENLKEITKIYLEMIFMEEKQKIRSLEELAQFIVRDLGDPHFQKRSELSDNARRCLIFMIGLKQITESITVSDKVFNIESLIDQCLNHLLSRKIQLPNIAFYEGEKRDLILKGEIVLDMETYNIFPPTRGSLEEYFYNKIFPEHNNEMNSLISKLEREMNYLQAAMIKFNDKVDLVFARNSESISKFRLTPKAIDAVIMGYRQQTQAIGIISYRAVWIQKNPQQGKKASIILNIYRETLHQSNKLPQQQILSAIIPINTQKSQASTQIQDKYYLQYLAQILKRNNLVNVLEDQAEIREITKKIINQILYEHGQMGEFFQKKMSQEKLIEIAIPRFSYQEMKKKDILNKNCMLETAINIMVPIVFIQANAYTEKFIQKMTKKYSAEIHLPKILPTDPFFVYYEDSTKFRWIIYNINESPSCQSMQILKSRIEELKTKIQKTAQCNTTYLFMVRNRKVASFIRQNIQPVYRFYYQSSIFSKLYHQSQVQSKNTTFEKIGKIYSFFINRSWRNISKNEKCNYDYLQLFLLSNRINQINQEPYTKIQALSIIQKMLNPKWSYLYSLQLKILNDLISEDSNILNSHFLAGYELMRQNYQSGHLGELNSGQQETDRQNFMNILAQLNKKYWINPTSENQHHQAQASWPKIRLIQTKFLQRMIVLMPKRQSKKTQENLKILRNLFQNKGQKKSYREKKYDFQNEKVTVLDQILTDPRIYILLNKTFTKIMMRIQNQKKSTANILQNAFKTKRSMSQGNLREILVSVEMQEKLNFYEKILIMAWGQTLIRGYRFSEIKFRCKFQQVLNLSISSSPTISQNKINLKIKSYFSNLEESQDEARKSLTLVRQRQQLHSFVINPIQRYPYSSMKTNDIIHNIECLYFEMGQEQDDDASDLSASQHSEKMDNSKVVSGREEQKSHQKPILPKMPKNYLPIYHNGEIIGLLGVHTKNRTAFEPIRSYLQI